MNGWLAAIGLAIVTAAIVLAFVPARRKLWTFVLAPIVLGLTGYALQGRADLPAAPAIVSDDELKAADQLIKMRADMDSSFGASRPYLVIADSYARDGNYRLASATLQGGLNRYPRDGDLWAAQGVVLLLASDTQMSPPAKLAFANARKYGRFNPAPDYFEGLVDLFEGRPANTLAMWQKLVDEAPDNALWKPKLESQLAGLKSMLQSAQATDAN
jgi:cytochrome c-type biogenesis protein CcmH